MMIILLHWPNACSLALKYSNKVAIAGPAAAAGCSLLVHSNGQCSKQLAENANPVPIGVDDKLGSFPTRSLLGPFVK